ILSIGAWIGGLYKAFIGTPPPNDAGQPEALTFVARIVIASFFVFWGSLAFQLARADHVRFWRNLLLVSLVLTLTGWAAYRWTSKKWICDMNDGKSYVYG